MKFQIKEARELAGYSQKELAGKIGVAQNTFHGYESGKHDPKSTLLIAIAKACHVTTDFLLGMTSDPNGKFNDSNKKSPSTDESALGDEQDKKIMEIVSKLTTDQKVLLLSLLNAAVVQNQGTPATAPMSADETALKF